MQVAPAIFNKKDKRMKRMMVIFILAILMTFFMPLINEIGFV